MDLHLQTAKCSRRLFGGVGIIVIGDQFQLQPVEHCFIFVDPQMDNWLQTCGKSTI